LITSSIPHFVKDRKWTCQIRAWWYRRVGIGSWCWGRIGIGLPTRADSQQHAA
jgi:hypothetical protein